MKTKHLLVALVLTGCSTSQGSDISYLQGTWSCKTVFEYDAGYIVEMDDITEADTSNMTYTKSADISAYYAAQPEKRSILHYKSECSFSVDEDYMSIDCHPTMTRIEQDDLSMYTPDFIDGFKNSFKPNKVRIIKVSDREVKFEDIEAKNPMTCEKQI